MIVVGSTNSSNSVRLREVALDAGAKAAYLVDFASEIHEDWLDGATTVGLTSGASVPDDLVMEVARLARRAWLRRGRRGDDGDREADLRAAARAAHGT